MKEISNVVCTAINGTALVASACVWGVIVLGIFNPSLVGYGIKCATLAHLYNQGTISKDAVETGISNEETEEKKDE